MTAAGADFLSRLAAKAVCAAPLVEPRLASRFEASAEGAGALGGAGDMPVETSAETENAWSASSLRRVAVQPIRSDADQPEAMPDQPLEAPPAPARARDARAAEPIVEVPPPVEAPARLLASPARPAAPADERLPIPEPVEPSLAAPPPAPSERQPQIDPRPAALRALPAPPARMDQAAPDRRATADPVATPASPAKAPPVLVPQAPPPTLAAPARAPGILPHRNRRDREPADATPQPPAVTITIGRVEVRAHSAAAPAARQAQQPRTAPQSLSDYFKQRNAAR